MIKSKRPNGSDFNLRDYLKRLKNNSQINKNIKFIYLICVFYGSTTIVSSLLNINIMIQFGSNFSLGAITSVFALVSIIVILLAKKFTKFGKRSWMFIAAGIAQIVGAVVFVCVPNMATLIIYNFSVAICEMLVATFFDVIRNKNLKEAGLYQDIAEHQCIVESIFQIVRVVTFALLIGVALLKNYILFQIIFVFFVVLHSITSILLARYEKVKNEKDN